jgi:heme/copper-type cytochrome/quinol oxidase subunit 2
MVFRSAFCWFAGICWFLAVSAVVADDTVFKLTIRNHRFEPTELVVPAGQKIKLEIENQDATPEEFESYELNREKVVPAKATVVIFVGPLKPGRYPFFGEFNKESAKGELIAK